MDTQLLLLKLREAQNRLLPGIDKTPLVFSPQLSSEVGRKIYCKLENLQKTGSFKARGAMNRLLLLSREEIKRGIITVSAGNHARAIAWMANELSIPTIAILPNNTSSKKVVAVESFGAKVILHGQTFEEAEKYAIQLAKNKKMVFISSYNDMEIILGQGTIGLEIINEMPEISTVIAPLGGGGLLSGLGIALSADGKKRKLIGVQAKNAPFFYNLLYSTSLSETHTMADGLTAGKDPNSITRELVKHFVDQIVLVEEEEIQKGIAWFEQYYHFSIEPTGIVALSAVLSKKIKINDESIAIIISGGELE